MRRAASSMPKLTETSKVILPAPDHECPVIQFYLIT
jgi:hypothetical protein